MEQKDRKNLSSIQKDLGIPLHSLRKTVDELRKGEALPDAETEGKKAERFALTALFIEEAWKDTDEWIRKHPPGFGVRHEVVRFGTSEKELRLDVEQEF